MARIIWAPQAYADLEESIREIIFRGYRVIYVLSGEQADEEVEILTVIHSSIPFGGAEPA